MRIGGMSLEFRERDCQQEFISEVTDEHLAGLNSLVEATNYLLLVLDFSSSKTCTSV